MQIRATIVSFSSKGEISILLNRAMISAFLMACGIHLHAYFYKELNSKPSSKSFLFFGLLLSNSSARSS